MSAGTPLPRGAIAPAGREVARTARRPSAGSRRVGTRQSQRQAARPPRTLDRRSRIEYLTRSYRHGAAHWRRTTDDFAWRANFCFDTTADQRQGTVIRATERKSARLPSFCAPRRSTLARALPNPDERDGDRLGARDGIRSSPVGDRDAAPAADARERDAVDEVRGATSGAANVAGSERARVPPVRR